ncbi:MAG: sigma-70 family RNA polymerase sigma factor [Tidjanibacter sp.]|jgi:RNA polymerase sigma-70 factor (ECF subfamily)|nr:sigma-70 family RNA polymerase sigma factor [Tidjanibacter sp.]MBQ5931032.1 sigma-70 family RNA polymerase sigma factor [Tidjanibacter sp.]
MIKNQVSLSDRELLEAYRAGNPDAISVLISRHSQRVYDYIRMLVKDSDLADDLFQETFVKAVRVIDQGRYTDQGRFLSWVMRIAHNQVIDHFRSQRKDHVINESEAGYDILGTQRLSEGSVEERMVGEQIEADLRRLIEQLPDEQREVVKMRYYGNLSFKEIAEQTEVSINTALGRMRYALINLRKMIKENNLSLE